MQIHLSGTSSTVGPLNILGKIRGLSLREKIIKNNNEVQIFIRGSAMAMALFQRFCSGNNSSDIVYPEALWPSSVEENNKEDFRHLITTCQIIKVKSLQPTYLLLWITALCGRWVLHLWCRCRRIETVPETHWSLFVLMGLKSLQGDHKGLKVRSGNPFWWRTAMSLYILDA